MEMDLKGFRMEAFFDFYGLPAGITIQPILFQGFFQQRIWNFCPVGYF